MKISTRILISLILSLLVLGACLIGISYTNTKSNAGMFVSDYEKSAYSFYENELKTIMEMMQQTANAIYKAEKAKGTSDEKIKETIVSQLDGLRFFDDKSGYIFIYDPDGTNVMLPTNKSLQGKNLTHLKDANGVFFVKELLETAKKGGGLVKYFFPKVKDGQPFLKYAYAVPFEPYNWMMGTGIYVDNVEAEVGKLKTQIGDNVASQIRSFLLNLFSISHLKYCSYRYYH